MGANHKNRIDVLDGLRSWAIILVILGHALKPFWSDYDQPFLNFYGFEFGNILANGWAGVDLFFVLSGFLITSQLLGRYSDERSGALEIKRYLFLRFFRIAPVFYLVMAVTLLGLFPYAPFPGHYDDVPFRIFYHLIFMQDYFYADIAPVFWSLGVEFKFYLLVPLLIILARSFRNSSYALLYIGLGLWALSFITRMAAFENYPDGMAYDIYVWNIRHPFHFALDGLVAGMICAFLWHRISLRAVLERPFVANSLFGVGFALFIGTCGFYPWLYVETIHPDIVYTGVALGIAFSCMLLGLLGGSKAGIFFRGRVYYHIALYSYGLYLVHTQMLYPAVEFAQSTFEIFSCSPQIAFLIYIPIAFLFSLAVAVPLYYGFEKLIIDWSKRKFLKQEQGGQT